MNNSHFGPGADKIITCKFPVTPVVPPSSRQVWRLPKTTLSAFWMHSQQKTLGGFGMALPARSNRLCISFSHTIP